MEKDKTIYIMGLGVPDPKGVFGSTVGLQNKFGNDRVMDMPTSENAMTGVIIGSAIGGMRPILTHQRIDFALLSMDQIVNQAAKWHYMFGGKMNVPIVIRLIIGRGWGQGPQHSQSLQALFAHIPGLIVIMPTTAYDAKGLLISAIENNNPVVFIEHRWLYNITDHVPEGAYRVPLGSAKIIREGKDVTIVASSYMSLEAVRAANTLADEGIDAEIVDLRTIKPLDEKLIVQSVKKTGRLVVADSGWRSFGIASEIITIVAEQAVNHLKSPPQRITLPDCPTPTSRGLTKYFYPTSFQIINSVRKMLGHPWSEEITINDESIPHDVPDKSFTGPF